jgi:hypothetical protein
MSSFLVPNDKKNLCYSFLLFFFEYFFFPNFFPLLIVFVFSTFFLFFYFVHDIFVILSRDERHYNSFGS